MSNDTKAEQKVIETIEKELTDPTTPKTTYENTVTLIKTETGWKIESFDTNFLQSIINWIWK
jgi:hypothetical protein